MKVKLIAMLCLTTFLALNGAHSSDAAIKATSMKIEKVQGTVNAKTSAGKPFMAISGTKLYTGNTVSTSALSYAYLSLDNTKAVKMDQKTIAQTRTSGKQMELLVKQGEVFVNVTKPLAKNAKLQIRTSTMVTGIRGTSVVAKVHSPYKSELFVVTGKVECTATNPKTGKTIKVKLKAGQKAISYIEEGDIRQDLHVIVKDYDESELPANVRCEIKDDKILTERINQESALNMDQIKNNAESDLKKEEESSDDDDDDDDNYNSSQSVNATGVNALFDYDRNVPNYESYGDNSDNGYDPARGDDYNDYNGTSAPNNP